MTEALARRLVEQWHDESVLRSGFGRLPHEASESLVKRVAAALSAARAEAMEEAAKVMDRDADRASENARMADEQRDREYWDGEADACRDRAAAIRALAAGQGGDNG